MKEREHERSGEDRPEHVDRATTDEIRQETEERDRDDVKDRRDEHAGEHRLARDLHLLGRIGKYEGRIDVEECVLGEARAHREKDASLVLREHLQDWHLHFLLFRLHFRELGAFDDLQADESAHADEESR